ncbi:AAA family ATPase [Azospirillum sp. sgz302134]
MAFRKVNKDAYAPRRWAVKGRPGCGKSHFIAAMRQPALIIDADGRRQEIKGGDLYELSDTPSDNRSPERIQDLLESNMPGSGIATIAVDSVTALIGASVARAMLDNAAGRNRNKSSAFVDKAEKMRLLQDTVSAYGTDVLYIWHVEDGVFEGRATTRETLPSTERERLLRSLNMVLEVVEENGRRGIRVEWARAGRSGMVIWDTEGFWKGVPEQIEAAVYAPSTLSFRSPADAVGWAVQQGAFATPEEAQAAYDQLRETRKPGNAREMFDAWIAEVNSLTEQRLIA